MFFAIPRISSFASSIAWWKIPDLIPSLSINAPVPPTKAPATPIFWFIALSRSNLTFVFSIIPLRPRSSLALNSTTSFNCLIFSALFFISLSEFSKAFNCAFANSLLSIKASLDVSNVFSLLSNCLLFKSTIP